MQSIKTRVAALEANASAEANNLAVVQIYPKGGETNDETIRNAGHDPDAPDTLFICFVALQDERISSTQLNPDSI